MSRRPPDSRALAWLGTASLAVAGLVIYGANAYVMVAIHWRHRRPAERRRALPDPLPAVTVQLPVFNERYVASRLLEAVAALDYPQVVR